MPHGHLPHLRRPALLRPDPRPAERCGARLRGRDGPYLRQRARGRSGDSTVTDTIESPMAHLSADQLDEIGRELAAIHDEVFAELGDRDRRYIVSMIEMHRRLVVLSRMVLLFSRAKPAWVAGTATLSLAKILENMEIGHNVMHGQWDWMNDPQINSSTWDWDSASTPEAWNHSHNYVHHTTTKPHRKNTD